MEINLCQARRRRCTAAMLLAASLEAPHTFGVRFAADF
jgi:hypothetical protein